MQRHSYRFASLLVMLALLCALPPYGTWPFTAHAQAGLPGEPAASGPSAALVFVENAGQWDDGARFQVLGDDHTLWLAEDAIWLMIVQPSAGAGEAPPRDRRPAGPQPAGEPRVGVAVELSFVDANPHPHLEPFGRLDTDFSYFLGNDPAGWRPDVGAWGGVRYVDLYPGVNLELTAGSGRLIPRLAARPGADLGSVRLRIEGADAVTVEGGALRLTTSAGVATWLLLQTAEARADPSVQTLGAGVFDVTEPFDVIRAPSATRQEPSPDDNPAELTYGTYLGGGTYDEDGGYAIAVDASGSAYVAGSTQSTAFPTTPGAFDPSFNGEADAFVVKLDAEGSSLAYATYLGGSSWDMILGLAVDGSGAVYVTGDTESTDFPTTAGAYDPSYNGATDTFVTKLNRNGTALVYGTYLGGSGSDSGERIAVDAGGAAYVTGTTLSTEFPTTPGAFDTSYNGAGDAFVVRLNAAGSALGYSTVLGGSYADDGADVALDGSGAAYVTGRTESTDFPTTSDGYDQTYNGGSYDAFVTKLSPAGMSLAYSSYLGGNGYDVGNNLAVDQSGAAYITGETQDSDFPTTPGAYDESLNGYEDVFVTKLNAAGSDLAYSTFLGGAAFDLGYYIAVDAVGAAYVSGETASTGFPTTPGAFDTGLNGGTDAFVARLSPAGSHLASATFLGGSDLETADGIAIGTNGMAYVTGMTYSADFPTTPDAFDTSYNDDGDAFVVKLAMEVISLSLPYPYTVGKEAGLERLLAYFDHQYPLYALEPAGTDTTLMRYDGSVKAYDYSGHDGYDFGLPEGTAVLAAASGDLSGACEPANSPAWYKGCWVAIRHASGYQTEYWHLKNDGYLRQSGYADARTRIGSVGLTGDTQGPHLHFAVNYDPSGTFGTDSRVDPYHAFPYARMDPWSQAFRDVNGDWHTGAASKWLWEFSPPVQVVVSPLGGGQVVLDWGLTVDVPFGAVLAPAYLDAGIISEPDSPGPGALTDTTAVPVEPAVQITAVYTDGTPIPAFECGITVTLAYTDTDVAYVNEATLALYLWDVLGESWTPLDTQLDLPSNTAQASVLSPGILSLRGEPVNTAPQVLGVDPASGSNQEDVQIAITGSGFLQDLWVDLGPYMSLHVDLLSSTALSATVPAGLPGGVYALTVTNPDGQAAQLPDAYTVVAPLPSHLYMPLVMRLAP